MRMSGSVGSGWSASVPASDRVDRPQVLDQPLHDPRLVEDRGQVGRIRRVDAVDDRLEVAGDHRQRRPQLVADVGQQRPPLLLVGLESGGHRVEAAGELLDRREIGAGAAEPDAVVALLDPPGGREHRVEIARRARHAAQQGRGDGDDARGRR